MPSQKLIAKVLGDSETRLARPDKADVVVRVDGVGQDLSLIIQTVSGLCGERPHLTAGEGPTVFQSGLGPELSFSHHVTVGLVVVRGDTSAEPVQFVVGREGRGGNLTREGKRQAGLPASVVELA